MSCQELRVHAEQVVPAAQIITPNQFELTCLTGLPVSTMEDALDAADAARGRGPEMVLITSVVRGVHGPGLSTWLRSTPRGVASVHAAAAAYLHRQRRCHSRDFLAALFAGLQNLPRVLAHTAAVIYGVLKITDDSGSYRTGADFRPRGTHPAEPRL